MTKLAFLDTETTGLNPDIHKLWEIAYILVDTDKVNLSQVTVNNLRPYITHFFLDPDISTADLISLKIGGYFQRHRENCLALDHDALLKPHRFQNWSSLEIARCIFTELQGAHIVGAVPDFDMRFLTEFLKRYGLIPTWHYHLICVENLIAGRLGIQPPWKSEELLNRIGVTVFDEWKHTALGDAVTNLLVYQKVMTRDYRVNDSEDNSGS